MVKLNACIPQDLGVEPKEVLGFKSDEELELALFPLMQISLQDENKDS